MCANINGSPKSAIYLSTFEHFYLLNFVICCYYQSAPGYKLHPPGCYYFLFFICNSLLFVAIINQPQFISCNPSSCCYYFFSFVKLCLFVVIINQPQFISCSPLVVVIISYFLFVKLCYLLLLSVYKLHPLVVIISYFLFVKLCYLLLLSIRPSL